MIKVFTKNRKGLIEFTEEELNDLLEKVFDEGRLTGRRENSNYPNFSAMNQNMGHNPEK